MNVKTMSKLQLSSMKLLSIIALAAGSFSFYFFAKKMTDFDCDADINVHIAHIEKNVEVTGVIKLFFHFIYGQDSHISEYGVVKVNNDKFILDRTARLHFSEYPQNGYYEVTRGIIEKNPQDNVPDQIYNEMTSKQKVLYFRMDEVRDGFWTIMDLRRTLILCKRKF